jgi:hypothetical protein
MSNLQIFNSPEFGQVRVVEIDNKPYAVGVDVARALEYAKPSQAVDATKVYSLKSYYGGLISAAEAAEEGIRTDGLKLATIEDLKAQAERDIGNAYGGPIEVLEGIFEFDFDTGEYIQLQ